MLPPHNHTHSHCVYSVSHRLTFVLGESSTCCLIAPTVVVKVWRDMTSRTWFTNAIPRSIYTGIRKSPRWLQFHLTPVRYASAVPAPVVLNKLVASFISFSFFLFLVFDAKLEWRSQCISDWGRERFGNRKEFRFLIFLFFFWSVRMRFPSCWIWSDPSSTRPPSRARARARARPLQPSSRDLPPSAISPLACNCHPLRFLSYMYICI